MTKLFKLAPIFGLLALSSGAAAAPEPFQYNQGMNYKALVKQAAIFNKSNSSRGKFMKIQTGLPDNYGACMSVCIANYNYAYSRCGGGVSGDVDHRHQCEVQADGEYNACAAGCMG
jgi:hypothetical protein